MHLYCLQQFFSFHLHGTASLAAKKAADGDKGSFRAQTSADRGVLKQVIAALVAPGERVADALRRLGAQRREKAAGGAAGGAAEDDAKLPPWRRKRKVAKSTATSTESKDDGAGAAGGMSDFDRLTEAADKLVQSGAVVGALADFPPRLCSFSLGVLLGARVFSHVCVIPTVCAASQLWICRSVSVDMHPLSRCALSLPLCFISVSVLVSALVSVLCRGVLLLCMPLHLCVSASRRVGISACLVPVCVFDCWRVGYCVSLSLTHTLLPLTL